jgi:predicted NUDIX family phosphoesterase
VTLASEFLVVAEQLMERENRPLAPREIVDLAFRDGLFSDKIAGQTPHQTMKAKLSVHVRRYGEESRFVRTGPGRFFLRRLLDSPRSIYHAPPLTPPPSAEEVLLFPTSWLDGEHRFQGVLTSGAERLLTRLFTSRVLAYRDRREAEELDDYKQVITYVLVTRGRKVLAYKRGNYSRVEASLKGAHCIGFGGHVGTQDVSLFAQGVQVVYEAAARELKEELELPVADRARLDRLEGLKLVGLLNDDATANGRRHFAVLLRYEVSSDARWNRPVRNEKSITQLRWLDPETSPNRLFEFEYWSQLCLLSFYDQADITKPTYRIRHRSPLRPPHLLVIVGEVGSGKSATTRILRSDYSYSEINSGQVLAKLMGVPPVTEDTRTGFQELAWDFIQRPSGPSELAEALWGAAAVIGSSRLLIDGIRQRNTLLELRRIAGPARVGVLFVHTPFNVAFEFYQERAGGTKSIYDFIHARNAPVEREVGELVAFADAVLYNWTGQSAYRRMVKKMMRELGIGQ